MNKEKDMTWNLGQRSFTHDPEIEALQTFMTTAACGCAFLLFFHFHRRTVDSKLNFIYFKKVVV